VVISGELLVVVALFFLIIHPLFHRRSSRCLALRPVISILGLVMVFPLHLFAWLLV